MLSSTHSETHISISICTPENAYPRLYDAILSTKYFDDETELAYFGYRYYSPEMGRWVSRDPIGDLVFQIASGQSGKQSRELDYYVFVGNQPISRLDMLGLSWKIERVSGLDKAQVSACADTVDNLGPLVGLRPGDYLNWMSPTVLYPLPPSRSSVVTGRWRIPNTVIAFWARDGADNIISDGFWKLLSNWWGQIWELQSLGFEVHAEDHVKDKRLQLQDRMEQFSNDKTLHGVMYDGHGGNIKLNNNYTSGENNWVDLLFPDRVSLRYKMALGIFYSCHSAAPGTTFPTMMVPSSEGGIFYGEVGWTWRPTWHQIGTYISPPQQGTH